MRIRILEVKIIRIQIHNTACLVSFDKNSRSLVSEVFVACIQEKALTSADLDDIWAAQAGKHEVSVICIIIINTMHKIIILYPVLLLLETVTIFYGSGSGFGSDF
jgi:hypothetical protein